MFVIIQGIDQAKLRTIVKIKSERGARVGRYIIASTTAKYQVHSPMTFWQRFRNAADVNQKHTRMTSTSNLHHEASLGATVYQPGFSRSKASIIESLYYCYQKM